MFCADSGCHSLVGLKIVYVQEDTLLLQLCSCVPHWLRPLHPSGFSFSIKFNWSPRYFWQHKNRPSGMKVANSDVPGSTAARELTPVHPWPPGIEPGQLYIMWSSVTAIPAQWNLLLNWLRESYFQCDSGSNYRRICFVTLHSAVSGVLDHTAPLSHFASSWGTCREMNCVHTPKGRGSLKVFSLTNLVYLTNTRWPSFFQVLSKYCLTFTELTFPLCSKIHSPVHKYSI